MTVRVEHLLHATPANGQAVDACLQSACQGLNFDLAEVWRRDSVMDDSKFVCVRHYRPSSFGRTNPAAAYPPVEALPNRAAVTSLSRQVRNEALHQEASARVADEMMVVICVSLL